MLLKYSTLLAQAKRGSPLLRLTILVVVYGCDSGESGGEARG